VALVTYISTGQIERIDRRTKGKTIFVVHGRDQAGAGLNES
jgi:hypothetical protein